jgi:hypothetical protein
MMKIKVSYTATVEEVIEVDEKFYGLTEPGGWNDLPNRERDRLTNELLDEVVDRTNADCQHNIICIEEDGTEELMYEG